MRFRSIWMSDAPFVTSAKPVLPEWIDYNGHLNMAYYGVLFDTLGDELYDVIGFGADYAATSGHTTYSAEAHICYLRELHEGDNVYCHIHLIDFDEKRFHFYQELYHTDGWRAATCEALGLHIDRSGPRVAPMPRDILDRLARIHAAHSALPTPDRVGRRIAIPRKPR
jgi:acyl-CoA thioester hydrolase